MSTQWFSGDSPPLTSRDVWCEFQWNGKHHSFGIGNYNRHDASGTRWESYGGEADVKRWCELPLPSSQNTIPQRMVNTLQFDLCEKVWIVGQQSYLVQTKGKLDLTERWKVSPNPVEIIGIKVSRGKVYYCFPGGGNCDGRNMYKLKGHALERIQQENNKLNIKN